MADSKIALENNRLLIETDRAGGELVRIYDKEKRREVLWEGDKRIWGRHSPVLFPFVGRCYENQYICDGKAYPMGQHGFARDMTFELKSLSADQVWYVLEDSEETRSRYPFRFCFQSGFRLEENRIRVMWRVENREKKDMHFMIGAHPAFRVPDHKTIYDYTFDFHQKGRLHYQAPDEDGYAREELSGLLDTGEGRVPLTKGFFQNVLTYIFDRGQIEKISLLLEEQPFVTVECPGFPYMAVWTMEETHPFVCLEPWFGRCAEKGFSGEWKDREGIVRLEGQGIFQADYVIEIH
ncbi:aldose 1-epimerase family protein [Lachnospiraceae bacterium 62-35]